jgi:Holliday junction resolvase-like predicted endonuclease
MLTEKQRIELLGAFGEDLVEKTLQLKGFLVKKSEDKYDSEKDFIVENLKVEVKTVVPWFTENALTIDASQYRKCYNADCVFFVCVPSKRLSNYSNTKYDGNIYAVDPKKATWIPKTAGNYLPKYIVRIDDPGVTLFHKITNEETLDMLRHLSTSKS